MTRIIGTKHYLKQHAFSIQALYEEGFAKMKSPHSHPSFEIFYVLNGGRVYFINGIVYTVRKGDMILIYPNDVHRTTSTDDLLCERILVNFTREFIEAELTNSEVDLLPHGGALALYRFPINEQPVIEEMLQKMLSECERKESGHITYVRMLMIRLLVHMHRLEQQENIQIFSHPMHQKISEVSAYLNQAFSQKVSLQKTAAMFFISPAYLSRIFKRITGFQFSEYLQLIRIREAKRLLRETDLSIGEIAEKAGFEHVPHFNITFKKWVHVTPGHYRKSNR